MDIILDIKNINEYQWQQLVSESPTSTWFQTQEAYRFMASVPSELEPFVVGVTREDTLVGLCVAYVTRERSRLKQALTARCIVIGGPLLAEDITSDELTTLLHEVRHQAARRGAIYIETRNFCDFSRWRSTFEACGFTYEPHLNFHVVCSSEEIVFKNMSESRRRQIKKAIKNGVTIEEANSIAEVKGYYNILQTLYKTKVKTPLFPWEFFETFYSNGYGKYLLVKKENEIIGGIMCPVLPVQTIFEWFVCGKDSEYKDCYPSVMATWGAIKYAIDNHIPRFDFMGAGTPNEAYGVRDFKARFGGKEVEHGRYKHICKPLLYQTGKLGVKILKHLKL